MRLRPIRTVFPCTTLFRSSRALASNAIQVVPSEANFILALFADAKTAAAAFAALLAEGLIVREVGVDRKSTRLNSSHLVISYAVFCLKKKSTYILPMSSG